MTCTETLKIGADVAVILTLLGGVAAWCHYRYGFWHKKRVLEKHLKREREADKELGKQGARTFRHLTAKLGLTESEILQASFNNSRIKRLQKLDADGFTKEILFQYNDDNSN